jgi:hypothetical protein
VTCSPNLVKIYIAPKRMAVNHWVRGSSPCWGAKHSKGIRSDETTYGRIIVTMVIVVHSGLGIEVLARQYSD